ncbi:MAG: FAD binding domain-containing protein [Ignavibacteriales bacterium]
MNSFKYIQPKNIKEASSILKKGKNESLLYAGGTDLLGLLKTNQINPKELVNLKALQDLSYVKYTKGREVRIGALTRISDIAEHQAIQETFTALAQAASGVASPQLRNMGTLGGNICQRPRCWYFREDFNCLRKGGDMCYAFEGENKYHCVTGGGPCYIVHPSDIAVALSVLDAKVVISSEKNVRTIPIKELFVLPDTDYLNETILKPGEIISEIIIPEPSAGSRSGFTKFKERDAWDFAVVSVAIIINKSNSNINSGKVVLGGVAPVPWHDENVNKKLVNMQANEDEINHMAAEILKKAEPLAKNSYKIPLVRNLTRRLLTELAV